MRIGFLFNHYAVHKVPHAAPYAFELSRRRPDFEVVVTCSSDALVGVRCQKPRPQRGTKAPPPKYKLYRCTTSSGVGPANTRISIPSVIADASTASDVGTACHFGSVVRSRIVGNRLSLRFPTPGYTEIHLIVLNSTP